MLGRHSLAVGFMAAVLLVWAAAMLLVLNNARLPAEASGRVVAVYPFGWSREAVLAAAMRTEALPVRETWLANAIELQSDRPDFVARLLATGATRVYRAQPLDWFAYAGCTGLPPVRLTGRFLG